MKNPVSQSEIEPATFRLVVHCPKACVGDFGSLARSKLISIDSQYNSLISTGITAICAEQFALPTPCDKYLGAALDFPLVVGRIG